MRFTSPSILLAMGMEVIKSRARTCGRGVEISDNQMLPLMVRFMGYLTLLNPSTAGTQSSFRKADTLNGMS